MSNLKDKIEKSLTPYLDTITVKVNNAVDKMGEKASDVFKDENKMQNIFRNVYESLPLFLRMGMKPETFVNFCMKHRDRFIKPDIPQSTQRDNDDTVNDADKN